ncbi:hypothetical protein RCL1_005388 [Eukaryota sp. TZLM3-RCL]
MSTPSSSQSPVPEPKPIIELFLRDCTPEIFSETVCLTVVEESKSSRPENTRISGCTFDRHDKSRIAFDRTDGVPLPSFLFHQPLANCYDGLSSEHFLRSYTFHDSCSMFVSFNLLRSLFHVETGSSSASEKQLVLDGLFQPFKNNEKYGRPNPYYDIHSVSQPDYLITADLSDIFAKDLSEDVIDQILADYYQGIFMQPHNVTGEKLDTTRNGFMNYPLLTVELKNERHSSCKYDPMLQCALYAVRCVGKNPIFTVIGCPTYLLLIDGTHVHLYSLSYTSFVTGPNTVAQQRFTVSLMYDFDFSRGVENSVLKFAAFFAHLKDSLSSLETYVRDCIKKRLSCSNYKISSLPRLDHFGISLRHLVSNSPLVFHGSYQDEHVTVKFTSSYAFDLHQKLADLELAPRLIQCKLSNNSETEPLEDIYKPIRYGNWFIVVMQRCAADALTQPSSEQLSVTISQLFQLKSFLHASCFVHGDLRPSNILFTLGGIKVVDFDWAGNTRSDCPPRYPFCMLHETYKELFLKAETIVGKVLLPTVELVRCSSETSFIKWPPGAYPGSLIVHEHDVYWIDQMIELLLSRKDDGSKEPDRQDNIDRAKDSLDAPIVGKRRRAT